MKKINLETIHQQSAFFVHLLNQAQIDTAMTYNILTHAIANNFPLDEIAAKLAGDYTSIYGSVNVLDSLLEQIDGHSDLVSHTSDSNEIIQNIAYSLGAIGDRDAHAGESLLTFLSRSMILVNLIFADLQKLELVFKNMCVKNGFNYRTAFEWIDEDAITTTIDDSEFKGII